MKVYLFRWYRHTQFDIKIRNGWLSLGLDRTRPGWRLIAYTSPDATPVHPKARGLGAEARR